VQEQHHYADYQQDVNETAGDVKGQEPKQPKNNQNRRDYSQHIFTPFLSTARDNQETLIAQSTRSDFSLDSCF
jgi:hypothetical protein